MTFSPEWDQIFRANRHISLWPWSELVSYVHRYAKPAEGFRRVLELGCGVGANIPFFVGLGVDYSAVEGSAAAVARLHAAYPELKHRILVGDFTKAIPFEAPFDLVVDRGALTSNATDGIQRALAMTYDLIRSGGKFIGLSWFSESHQDATHGDAVDPHTRTNLPTGHLAGLGAIHFSDKGHLVELLTAAGFRVERLEHNLSEIVVPDSGDRFAWWNFVAVKP